MTKDIEKIKEIMSDRRKFLRNVSDVEFVFKCYSKNMNPKNEVYGMDTFVSSARL